MAVASARSERCASLAVADLVRVADRAGCCWEHDRGMAVEAFAARLTKEPRRVARGLYGSKQGAEWLVEHWDGLADVARKTGRWDDDQRRLAFDLLGVPHELRNVATRVPEGDDAAALVGAGGVGGGRVRDCVEEVLDDLNDAERAMAMAGMPLSEDAATARLRKEESRARNDFARARNELLRLRASRPAGPGPRRRPPPLPEAAVKNFVTRTLDQVEYLDRPARVEDDEVKAEAEAAVKDVVGTGRRARAGRPPADPPRPQGAGAAGPGRRRPHPLKRARGPRRGGTRQRQRRCLLLSTRDRGARGTGLGGVRIWIRLNKFSYESFGKTSRRERTRGAIPGLPGSVVSRRGREPTLFA